MLKVPICLSKHHVNSSARWSECITGVSEYFIRKCGKVRNGQDTDKRVSMEHKICEMSHQTSLFHSQILQCKTKRCEYPHISGTYGDIDKMDDHIYPYCCNLYRKHIPAEIGVSWGGAMPWEIYRSHSSMSTFPQLKDGFLARFSLNCWS